MTWSKTYSLRDETHLLTSNIFVLQTYGGQSGSSMIKTLKMWIGKKNTVIPLHIEKEKWIDSNMSSE